MTQAALSALILAATLILFASERVRHDLVALLALLACLVTGLVSPEQAFRGFSDPAVLAVAGVLVVGRAIEVSGLASSVARLIAERIPGFVPRLVALLAVAALLSAFMNNIAALVITMPVAAAIARDAHLPPGATLMPLAFATILGGMTTLIGTPANLILSSIRDDQLGAPLGFFAMSPVGTAVALAGLAYLALLGWRFLPHRRNSEDRTRPLWYVFEMEAARSGASASDRRAMLRAAGARLLANFRGAQRIDPDTPGERGDRLLVLARTDPWALAGATDLAHTARGAAGSAIARVVVAHGSPLIDRGYDEVRTRSAEAVEVLAAGPRASRARRPLVQMRIHAGDQLFLHGEPEALASLISASRLLEVNRLDRPPVNRLRAAIVAAIFAGAIAAIVFFSLSPALAFVGAAVLLASLRLLPAEDVYRSIDWSVLVLLAAMIPVGQSFDESGAAAIAAQWLGSSLAGAPLFIVLAALCTATMLLSIFLNNIATAIVMGPLAIEAARLLDVNPNAALLAVLIGASSDFLTPIGHQNNLLVMGPGGYRFTDYARVGAPLVLIVILVAAAVLSAQFGSG
ncbi:MAG: anion permease [Sphingopyxis sp.]|uniref:SLC13 family permease n=1 Tax=Sphingopyxis sp. TaxID=1908224 RepID=UPI001A450322|nr:SLC13 family permease [Sphingopyxis sp.]MBL9070676.1 anion permease [Sphingopyxis sp.]